MESVEFFQFHGIRPWNSFSSTESVEIGGIWRHISMECRGILTSLPAPLFCRHFSWKPRHLLKNSVRILHGSIPRNSTMIPWHIYRRVLSSCLWPCSLAVPVLAGWVYGFVVLCPGTPEGSTGSCSGFKVSQKTGQA